MNQPLDFDNLVSALRNTADSLAQSQEVGKLLEQNFIEPLSRVLRNHRSLTKFSDLLRRCDSSAPTSGQESILPLSESSNTDQNALGSVDGHRDNRHHPEDRDSIGYDNSADVGDTDAGVSFERCGGPDTCDVQTAPSAIYHAVGRSTNVLQSIQNDSHLKSILPSSSVVRLPKVLRLLLSLNISTYETATQMEDEKEDSGSKSGINIGGIWKEINSGDRRKVRIRYYYLALALKHLELEKAYVKGKPCQQGKTCYDMAMDEIKEELCKSDLTSTKVPGQMNGGRVASPFDPKLLTEQLKKRVKQGRRLHDLCIIAGKGLLEASGEVLEDCIGDSTTEKEFQCLKKLIPSYCEVLLQRCLQNARYVESNFIKRELIEYSKTFSTGGKSTSEISMRQESPGRHIESGVATVSSPEEARRYLVIVTDYFQDLHRFSPDLNMQVLRGIVLEDPPEDMGLDAGRELYVLPFWSSGSSSWHCTLVKPEKSSFHTAEDVRACGSRLTSVTMIPPQFEQSQYIMLQSIFKKQGIHVMGKAHSEDMVQCNSSQASAQDTEIQDVWISTLQTLHRQLTHREKSRKDDEPETKTLWREKSCQIFEQVRYQVNQDHRNWITPPKRTLPLETNDVDRTSKRRRL